MKIKSMGLFFLAVVATVQFGCGGGGGGGGTAPVVPTQAIVKVATSGTLPAGTLIGGIDVTLTYPTTKGLSITDSNVIASGVSAGSLIQPNLTNPGQARVALVSATGIQTGEFATLTFNIASGNSPVAGDFVVAATTGVSNPFVNTNGTAIPGMTVTIASVTFQ